MYMNCGEGTGRDLELTSFQAVETNEQVDRIIQEVWNRLELEDMTWCRVEYD